jgi:hypothetical protein
MREEVDSFTCVLSITNGASLPLVMVDLTMTINGLNKATVHLAVGNWEINNRPNDITLSRGASASISVAYPGLAGTTRIFSGVLFDYAPSTTIKGGEGQMMLEVILYGRIYHLTTGTLHSGQTVPSSYLDANSYWSTAALTTGSTKRASRVDEATAQSNFGSAYLTALEELANGSYSPSDSVSEFIKDKFGSDINEAALDVLGDIETFLVFRNFTNRKFVVEGIVGKINEGLQGDWAIKSFSKQIEVLGTLMYFSLLETGDNIYLVPFSPFFETGSAFVITPDTYHAIRAGQAPDGTALNFKGAVLTSSVGVAQKDTPVAGYFKGPASSGGQVYVSPMPSIFVRTANDLTTDTTASGARTSLDVSSDLANDIAKYVYLDQRYRSRTYYVDCPYLRLDLAPLTPVRIQTPRSNEIQATIGASTIYGIVTSIRIHLDSTQGVAETTLEVGYARNQVDQKQLISPIATHPLWAINWRGSTLSGNRR